MFCRVSELHRRRETHEVKTAATTRTSKLHPWGCHFKNVSIVSLSGIRSDAAHVKMQDVGSHQDISSYNELAFVSLGGLQNLPEGEKQTVLELELEYVNPISQKAGLYV